MSLLIIVIMILSPLLGIPLLFGVLYATKGKIDTKYAIPFAILYGTLGYNLYPNSETDLTRYYTMVDRLRNVNLIEVLATDIEQLYTKDILFYFISQTENNQILPFIVGVICYWIVFYIFFDTVNRLELNKRKNGKFHIIMLGLVMTSIISPYSIIGNVRCVLSYFIVSFAAYREWVQKKKNLLTYILYIIPIGLHTSTIIVLIMRLITPFLHKMKKGLLTIILFLPSFIEVGYEITKMIHSGNFIWKIISSAIDKAYYYLNWTEGGWADMIENSLSDRLNRVYGTVFLLIMIILYLYINKEKTITINYESYNKIQDYLYIIAILALGCLSIKTGAFWRFEAIVVVFSPIILGFIVKEGKKQQYYILYTIYASAMAMFVLNGIHFTRNINMEECIYGYLTTSPLVILAEIFHGMFSIVGGY